MKNEKGEDWGKYLKELQGLQPILRKEMGEGNIAKDVYKPIFNKEGVPINDPTVKKREKSEIFSADGKVLNAKGKKEKFAIFSEGGDKLSSTAKKIEDASKHIKDNIDNISTYMQCAINDWISEQLKPEFSSVEWRALQEGDGWPMKKRGYLIDIQHEKKPLPFGSDVVTIFKKRSVLAQTKFVWEYDV